MLRSTLVVIAAIAIMLAVTRFSLAQEQPGSKTAQPGKTGQCMPRLPLWEAGVFGAAYSQPSYPGADERANLALALPFVVYRGEHLRVDRSTVGVRAKMSRRTELDLGFAATLGSRAADSDARRGMDDLGTLLEFGPRLKIYLGDVSDGRSDSRIQLAVRSVFDANDHLSDRGIAVEPQWVKDMQPASDCLVTANLGAVFGDKKLADTFYRVAPGQATSTRPAYEARSGLISLSASLFASRLLTPDARLFSYLRFDSLAGAANYGSPLVRRNNGWSAGLGIAWTLAYSGRYAKD